MRNILFLALHRKNRSPGQRFRFEQYIPLLEQAGFECTLSPLLDEKADKAFYSHGNYFKKAMIVFRGFFKRLKDLRRAKKYGIVFIYRDAFFLGNTWFEKKLSRLPCKIIMDFDDAVWLMDVSVGNRKLAFLKNPGKTEKIIKYSDLIITGNSYLASYAMGFNNNTSIIPTTIDTSYHVPGDLPKKDGVCIGWTGTETTVKHFEGILPVLIRIKEKYGQKIYFKLVSNNQISFPELELESTIWDAGSEIGQLLEMDIGIMPLPDDEWSKGKCGFKGLQYMSLEIPAIMSPVGVNTQIIENNVNGLLVKSDMDWFDGLSKLIEEPLLREKLGKAGRETVENRFSVNSQKEKYIRLFESLVEGE